MSKFSDHPLDLLVKMREILEARYPATHATVESSKPDVQDLIFRAGQRSVVKELAIAIDHINQRNSKGPGQ